MLRQPPMRNNAKVTAPRHPRPHFGTQNAMPSVGKRQMMDDGGMPSIGPVGGSPKTARPAYGAPPPAANPMDPDNDGDMDSMPKISPEAVNYHDEPHACSMCQYFGEGQQCAVLQMQVSPEGGCTAFSGGQDQSNEGQELSDVDDGETNDDMSGGGNGGY